MNGGDFQHFIGEWWKAGLLLMDRHHDLEAAHVGLQDLGDGDTAIGLQMVLEECDEHTRRSHAGVVQSVGQIGLAILALDAACTAGGLQRFYGAANCACRKFYQKQTGCIGR